MKLEDRKKAEGKRPDRDYKLIKMRMNEIVRLMFEEPQPVIKIK